MSALLAVALAWAGGFAPFTPAPPCAGMPHNTSQAREAVIRCVADHHLGGGEQGRHADKAVRVAKCEAYDALRARVVSNGNYGVFQMRYWQERWTKWGKPLGVRNDPLSLLANAHVALSMVAEYGGWGHWSCGDA